MSINWESPVTWLLIVIVVPPLVTLIAGVAYAVVMGSMMSVVWMAWRLFGKSEE